MRPTPEKESISVPTNCVRTSIMLCATQLISNTLNLVRFVCLFLSFLSFFVWYLSSDFYSAYSHRPFIIFDWIGTSYSDESPLIPNEFLHEPHITAQDLGGDPILRLMEENEPDLWISYAHPSFKRSLREKQVGCS